MVILARHQPPSEGGFTSCPHSPFLLWPSAEELSKHSGRHSVQPAFQGTKHFYSFLLPALWQRREARATAIQAERGRRWGSGFPTVPQAALTNPGTEDVSRDNYRSCLISLMWANTVGCFPPPSPATTEDPSAFNLFTCCFLLSWYNVGNALTLCLSFSRYKRPFIFLLCFPRSCNLLLISVCKTLSSSSKGRCKRKTKYH